MNKIIVVIAIVFAFTLGTIFSADIATALKPATEVLVTNTEPIPVTGSISSDPACPTENVQHWVTLFWAGAFTINHPTLSPIFEGILEIQVPLDENNPAKGLVVAKLTELGYLDATNQPLDTTDISNANVVGSSTICAEN